MLQSLHDYFQTTTEFPRHQRDARAPTTSTDQAHRAEVRGLPDRRLSDRRTRGIFLEWRDELALRSPRQADYAWTVLARVLSVSLQRGKIDCNPATAGERLYRPPRVDKIWTLDVEEAFLKSAPEHLHLPLLLALWTGQREGDLLRLSWSAYDGKSIRLRPRKTSPQAPARRAVTIPVGAPLQAVLDAAPRPSSPIILLSSEGKPWTEAGFRASFNKARDRAGVVGLTFNDMRGTAVTRLALCGAPSPISPPSPATASRTCAPSSMPTTSTAISSWRGAPSASSNWASPRRADFPNCAPNCTELVYRDVLENAV